MQKFTKTFSPSGYENAMRAVISVLLMGALSACGTLVPRPSATQPAAVTGTPSTPVTATAISAGTPAPQVLRLWLPLQFDPQAVSPAARLLRLRLELFESIHPGVTLDVRIKDGDESAGLLEMLALARAAAPESLPDLVALPRDELEDAALKGIIHPIEGLTDVLDDSGWYSYARQLAHVQNSTYSLPFAGDALVLAYDPAKYATPPENWDAILERPGALVLTGERPQVRFLISLYRSMNGGLLDAQNQPMLESFALEPTLSLLEKARLNNTRFVEDEAAAWDELLGGRAAWIVISATRALAEPSGDFQVAALPGLNNDPFTLGTAWAWALAGPDLANQALAIELAEWLIDDDFLSAWVDEAGYLHTRSEAANERFPALATAAETAQPVPSNDLLAALEPVLADAAARILDGEPVEAAVQAALESLK